jgi:hypothetical protein
VDLENKYFVAFAVPVFLIVPFFSKQTNAFLIFISDDANGLKQKHNRRGTLSMGNGGKNSNTSQFFVTLKDSGAPICDKKHVMFGQLKYGFDTLDFMQELIDAALEDTDTDLPPIKTGEEEFPPLSIIITGCGEWTPGDIIQGYYDASNVFIPKT